MGTRVLVAVLSLLGLMGIRSVYGEQPPPAVSLPLFEVTPFLGYRFSGHLEVEGSGETASTHDHAAYAVALDVRWTESQQVGLFYSRESTTIRTDSGLVNAGLDVEDLYLDGTVYFESPWLFSPYLIGGLGLTRLRLDAPDTNDDSRFSIAAGGGLRFPVRPRLDVRLEMRAYIMFMDTNSSAFCAGGRMGGACVLRGTGSAFVQYDVLLGAALAF